MNKAEIEKGCGELIDSEYSHRECGILFLGTIELCPTCQARLSQRIDDEKEFRKIAINWKDRCLSKKDVLIGSTFNKLLSSLDNGGMK